MRKILSGVIAASFVATVGLSAQQAPPTSPPAAPGGGAQQPAPSAQAGGQSRTVTLSGCIQNAPSATASAAGASASASASTAKFVLATKPAAGATGAAVGTSGTATRYQLDGEDKAISPHLNHQVEITGTVQNSGASSSAGAGGAGAAGAAGGASAPTLKVDSVKMVAATCS